MVDLLRQQTRTHDKRQNSRILLPLSYATISHPGKILSQEVLHVFVTRVLAGFEIVPELREIAHASVPFSLAEKGCRTNLTPDRTGNQAFVFYREKG
jgi:hypothetical protein